MFDPLTAGALLAGAYLASKSGKTPTQKKKETQSAQQKALAIAASLGVGFAKAAADATEKGVDNAIHAAEYAPPPSDVFAAGYDAASDLGHDVQTGSEHFTHWLGGG